VSAIAGAKQMLGVLTVAALISGLPALPQNEVVLSGVRSVSTAQEKKAEEEASRKRTQGALSFLQASPSREAETLAEAELTRAERHAREAKESAALARYAYEKLAASQEAAADAAGQAVLEDVILDARRDAREAMKLQVAPEIRPLPAGGLSFQQEQYGHSSESVALQRAEAILARVRSSTKTKMSQPQQTTKELQQDAKLPVETHQILAPPVASDAESMRLPGASIASIFTQLASQEKMRSRGKAEVAVQKLATAEQALSNEQATATQKLGELAKMDLEIQKLQQAAKLQDGEVATVKKKNLVLLETLRSMSRADKAQRQSAEAESKRLASVLAAKEQELRRQRQELTSKQAQAAALQQEVQKQGAVEEKQKTEVSTKTILLQRAQDQLQSTQMAVSDLTRQEAQSAFDLRVIKEEQLGTATGKLTVQHLQAALKKRMEREEALEKVVGAQSKSISDLSFALEQERYHPQLQELRKRKTAAANALKEKAGTARKTIGLLQQEVAQQTSQLRAKFRAKSIAVEAKRQDALIALEAKLERATLQETAILEEKNRSVTQELLVLQQKDEAQVEVRRQKVKAQQLQKQLDAVKAEESQLLDKAAKAALKVEANLQDSQKSVDQELQLKEQKVLNLQHQKLENAARIQSLQKEMAEASLQEKKLEEDLKQTKEQRGRLVTSQEVQLNHAVEKVRKAQHDEEKRRKDEIESLQHQIEAEHVKSHFQRAQKAAQLEREIQKVPQAEEADIAQLGDLLKEKESKLRKVREFLASEGYLSSRAKVELKNLRERLQN